MKHGRTTADDGETVLDFETQTEKDQGNGSDFIMGLGTLIGRVQAGNGMEWAKEPIAKN